uniref:Integrase_H2C2 domain-containing protein n=1 Tax=Strongyloides venezuelensis TaxID=75913 RepID=A0A0K0FPS7_STRVS
MEQEKNDNFQRAIKNKYFLNYDVRVNDNGIIQICKTNLKKGKAYIVRHQLLLLYSSAWEMIKKILNSCNTCLIRNSAQHHQPSNTTIDLLCYPFDRLPMDFIIPKTINQICHHKYILVVCDECTMSGSCFCSVKKMEDYPIISYCQLLDLMDHFRNNSRVIGMQMTPVEIMFGISP